MRFVLRTAVGQPPDEVFPVFGEASFVESLAPGFMGLKVVKIGLELGDEIEVRFTKLGPRTPWTSRIDELDNGPDGIRFVDRSGQIPWPLAWLHHHHGFLVHGEGTLLVDDVRFRTRPAFIGIFVWPVLRLSFGLRRGAYRKRFGRPSS
jgi:ligand-binding SRPBCC domain-containing protein